VVQSWGQLDAAKAPGTPVDRLSPATVQRAITEGETQSTPNVTNSRNPWIVGIPILVASAANLVS
jgi:hypothetical protein